MQISKLEVKNISYYARGSEETPCYNATVYINGKKAIEISNDGRGGMDMQHQYDGFEHGIVQQANEWCKKKFGKESFTYTSDGEEEVCSYDIDLEQHCHKVLYDWLDTKSLKKDMKALELFLQDKEDYKEYCSYIKWEQPDISVYKKELKSQLPENCKK